MTKHKHSIALVTGATGGLGTHMVKRLIDDGYEVVGNYR
ncbi:MAG: NAD-dependent epimerase/dehydratase family protein, partial [Saprospiraceae bacterium]|nr:NAD-dependent epimerase/dehydratase family protein [Saprospiraceae bacterium]